MSAQLSIHPETLTNYDILDKVFLNNSPPDTTTLCAANRVLKDALSNQTSLDTPITHYVTCLANETERLTARHIICQHDTDNL
jgi:hypothetical protein